MNDLKEPYVELLVDAVARAICSKERNKEKAQATMNVIADWLDKAAEDSSNHGVEDYVKALAKQLRE